jgi:hypothetical protein
MRFVGGTDELDGLGASSIDPDAEAVENETLIAGLNSHNYLSSYGQSLHAERGRKGTDE